MGVFPNLWVGFGAATETPFVPVEPADPGYARAAILFTPLSAGAPCTNVGAISIGPAVAAWPTLVWTMLYDAETGGNCLMIWPDGYGTIAAGSSLSIAAAGIGLTFGDAAGILAAGQTIFNEFDIPATSLSGAACTVVASQIVFDVAAAWPSPGVASPSAPSAGAAGTPFTDAERTDIRRFCGYPAYGAAASGFQSWRFFQAYGELEYRMTNLAVAELAVARSYLAQLYVLEAAVPAAGQNLDTQAAAIWTRNPREVPDRFALLAQWSRRLATFLGVPFAPLSSAGGGAIVI